MIVILPLPSAAAGTGVDGVKTRTGNTAEPAPLEPMVNEFRDTAYVDITQARAIRNRKMKSLEICAISSLRCKTLFVSKRAFENASLP